MPMTHIRFTTRARNRHDSKMWFRCVLHGSGKCFDLEIRISSLYFDDRGNPNDWQAEMRFFEIAVFGKKKLSLIGMAMILNRIS